MKSEQILHKAVCNYIRLQYPTVYFMSDPSGLRVTPGIRRIIHSTRSKHAALDIVILEPMKGWNGKIIELKSTTPFKKDGNLKKDDHLEDQRKSMEHLAMRGYSVSFAWDFDRAKVIIDNYLTQC